MANRQSRNENTRQTCQSHQLHHRKCKLQCTTVLIYHMIHYVYSTLLTLYMQPKHCDLSTNYRTDVEHFCENSIYHYRYIFYYKYRNRSLVWNHYGRLSSIPFLKSSIPFLKSSISFHSKIFHIPYLNFRSISFPFHFFSFHTMPYS